MVKKRKAVTNDAAANMLQEIADVLKMDEVAFKPQAYERAAEAIRRLPEPFVALYEREGLRGLEGISGVGKSIAAKLEELAVRGTIKKHQELKKKMPADIEALKLIDGIGVKSIEVLYQELGITSVAELEEAAKQKKIREISGFGEKTEETILESIRFHQSRGDRFVLHRAKHAADRVAGRISELPGVRRVAVAGSIRRGRETIGDADILVVAEDGEAVAQAVTAFNDVDHVYSVGPTKTMVRLENGMDVDVRVIAKESWGAALHYFTGSKEHNVHMRRIAVEHNLTLNEYGLYQTSGEGEQRKKGKKVAGSTEQSVYEALKMAYVEPELREDEGEIEEAQKAYAAGVDMPRLITRGDLLGDLQTQSDWTDGKDSIEDLAKAAKEAGLEYIAITDHTKRLTMAHGLDAARVRKQMAEIDKINRKLSGITILRGTECDILRDGSLDLPDDVLSELDVVGIAVHSYFNLPQEEQTDRIIRAMENPHVDILFHPTGRVVGRRDAYRVDMGRIIEAAVQQGVALEINGSLRLDLHAEHVRLAREKGAKFAVSSDAHRAEHFAFLDFGIMQARRGAAQAHDVINTRKLAGLRSALRSHST